jgi:hypothetical protein
MRRFLTITGLALLALVWAKCNASEPPTDSPIGLWQTYDETSGLLRALVRIKAQNGLLVGRIEQTHKLPGDKDDGAYCNKCSDDRKGQPLEGMVILTGLRENGEFYDGGEILDPENGITYRCRIRVFEKGQLLDVRGYIGVSLFGRSQTWRRHIESQ